MPLTTLGQTYLVGTVAYGFHRGWTNRPFLKGGGFSTKDVNELYTDRLVCAMTSAVVAPLLGPILVHGACRRTEKRIRKIEIEDVDWLL